MWTAWFLLGFIQLGSARWFTRYWKYSSKIHAVSGFFITAITLYEGFSAFQRIGKVEGHLHNVAGFILTCSVILVSLTGSLAMKVREVKWNTFLIRRSRFVHKVLGYIAFFSSTMVLSTGIFKFAKRYREVELNTNLGYLIGHILVMIGIYIALEINFRYLRSEKIDMKNDLPQMDIQEFHDNI